MGLQRREALLASYTIRGRPASSRRICLRGSVIVSPVVPGLEQVKHFNANSGKASLRASNSAGAHSLQTQSTTTFVFFNLMNSKVC